MSVVGGFDAREIKKLVTELFSGWKNAGPCTRIEMKAIPGQTINQSFETPDKSNAFFAAAFNFEFRDDHADYPAMVLGNHMRTRCSFGGNAEPLSFHRSQSDVG